MDLDTWETLITRINNMVEYKVLNETQIGQLIDLIDLKKLVTTNKLNPKFIENVIRPKIENDFSDFGDCISNQITLTEIYKLQQQIK